jgi:hypothetical protein
MENEGSSSFSGSNIRVFKRVKTSQVRGMVRARALATRRELKCVNQRVEVQELSEVLSMRKSLLWRFCNL